MIIRQRINPNRNLPAVSRFLEVAALSSGEQINYHAIASDSQIPRTTVQEYFKIANILKIIVAILKDWYFRLCEEIDDKGNRGDRNENKSIFNGNCACCA